MIQINRPFSLTPTNFEKPKPEDVQIVGGGYAEDAQVMGTPRVLEMSPKEAKIGIPFGELDPSSWLRHDANGKSSPGVSSQQILQATPTGKKGLMPNPETGRAIFFTQGQPGVSARAVQTDIFEQTIPLNKEAPNPFEGPFPYPTPLEDQK